MFLFRFGLFFNISVRYSKNSLYKGGYTQKYGWLMVVGNSVIYPDPHHFGGSASASNKNQDPDPHQSDKMNP
jgi:hypothetical protein